MAAKGFFEVLRQSIRQIVSGDEKSGPSASELKRKKSSQQEIEAAVIVLAAEIMRIEGNYTAETRQILFEFLDKNFGKSTAAKRNKLLSSHILTGPQPFTKMACEQLKTMATQGSKNEIIKLLYQIATQDDFAQTKENNVIQKIARFLDISAEELRALKEKFSKINNPFTILEIEDTTSVTKVKAAYRKVVLKYHPDKRTGKVSDEEANRKFREVKRAYEVIMNKLGA
jgi:DnaJ like chaperone protein